jgi:DNA repair exonuclease SbcCD ATPase subunit
MGQRLLLVDSDRSFLKEHQVSLEAAFDLEVSASPDGVIPRLEHGGYAAVLICVEVAENKGYALCSTIRKNPKLTALKVALISAKASEEEYRRHQSLKGRADLYLHKPVAPSALVAALTPLVPGRTLDPDNPLGELVDTELGDDWLDGLKSALEEGGAVPAPPPPHAAITAAFEIRPEPVSPSAVTRNLDMKATAPPDTTRTRLLEEQVAALHQELRAKDQRLQATAAELLQLQRQLSSVTQNLDEMERRNREAEDLKHRLAEAEVGLRRLEENGSRDGETLKTQLKEALTERTDLLHQVEALNLQLGEKTQRTIELLKERDRLQHQVLELETTLEAREGALAEAREAQAQLNTTLEGVVEKQAGLEELHQAALLEVAAQKERAHTLQLELAGLEATMRGQGRDLAELSERLQQAEAENGELREAAAGRDRRLQTLARDVERLEGELQEASQQAAEARQRLDEAIVQHEGERLELMNGVDQKEAELNRMAQALQAQQEAQVALEGEKQEVEARLVAHRERLGQMDELLQEVVERLRRGSDLARG